MKTALVFNDTSDDRISERDFVYENFNAPIPNVGEIISLDGQDYKIFDRYFMYFNNLNIDLQIVFRCEEFRG